MSVRFLECPVMVMRSRELEDPELAVRRVMRKSFYFPNEYLEHFVVSEREPLGDPGYDRIHSELYDMFSIGNFALPVRIFDKSRAGSFRMRWTPRCEAEELKRGLWFIVRVNLIMQIWCAQSRGKSGWTEVCLELSRRGSLLEMAKHLLSRCTDGMLRSEHCFPAPTMVPHGDVPGRRVSSVRNAARWRGEVTGVTRRFWGEVRARRGGAVLRESAARCAEWALSACARSSVMVAGAWQMAFFMAELRRCGLPDDSSARSPELAPALCRAAPLYDWSVGDLIPDASFEVQSVVGSHPALLKRMVDHPVTECIRWALPHAEAKKSAYARIMGMYRSSADMKSFLDGCLTCVALGLFDGAGDASRFRGARHMSEVCGRIASGEAARSVGELGAACAVRSYALFASDRNQTIMLEQMFSELSNASLPKFRGKCARNRAILRDLLLGRSGVLERSRFVPVKGQSEWLRGAASEALLSEMVVRELFGPNAVESAARSASSALRGVPAAVGLSRDVTQEIARTCGCSEKCCAFLLERKNDARALGMLPLMDKYILYAASHVAVKNSKMQFHRKSSRAEVAERALRAMLPPGHFEMLYYETCCCPPSVLNISWSSGKPNECGLRETYVGAGKKLYCSEYVASSENSRLRSELDAEIMKELRADIDAEMRRSFFYMSDRRYTYQLYRYLTTGVSNFPSWTIDGSDRQPSEANRSDKSEVLLLRWRWTADGGGKPSVDKGSLAKDYDVVRRVPPLYRELFRKSGDSYAVDCKDMVHAKDFGIKTKRYVAAMRKHHEREGGELLQAPATRGALAPLPPGWKPAARATSPPIRLDQASFPVCASAEGVVRSVSTMLKRRRHPIKYINKRLKHSLMVLHESNECLSTCMVGKVALVETSDGMRSFRLCALCGSLVQATLAIDRAQHTCGACGCCQDNVV